MATRPSPASDAAIRAQYYRGTRRSPQAQAIARDLERTGVGESLAVSRWNRGEDPALQAVSRANATTAARGFSAAAADRGRAMQSVNEALQTQPDSSLPPAGREMFGRMQNRLPGNAEEFLRDADEYSGRRARNYNIGGGRSERNAESRPAATVRGSATRTEVISSDPDGPTVTTSRPANAAARELDLMSLRAEAERRAKADKSRPNMDKFYATAPERERRVAEQRNQNQEESARRFKRFVADNEIGKREKAQAESYLRTYRQKAANLRQSAAESTLDGRERNGEFWSELENANYNMAYLDSVPVDEQIQWAREQLKEEEESRGRIDRAARNKTTEQEPFISAFTGGSGGTISDLLPGYFSNINIR